MTLYHDKADISKIKRKRKESRRRHRQPGARLGEVRAAVVLVDEDRRAGYHTSTTDKASYYQSNSWAILGLL